MKYQFVRTGNKPVKEIISYDSEDNTTATQALRNCFEFCTPQVKKRLEKFIGDKQRDSIKFKFDNFTVEIEKLVRQSPTSRRGKKVTPLRVAQGD